ncbi:reverse transcriptase domain-containing protein [Xanthomonas sp. 10-10]|uniref:RNA-directed DNA polymerase n=1 Tax=Xanthomonas sp. 10-10 TaxID=3115848 RepID=A0AAU7P8X5_9XANT
MNEALARSDVARFSMHVFGVGYDSIQGEIYPAQQYRAFQIPKKTGGLRQIYSPRLTLKNIQRQLLKYLLNVGPEPKNSAHGFRLNRSIVSNAKAHCQQRAGFILNLDLEDFFPSITFYRVRGLFSSPIFGFSHQVASLAAHICTFRNTLPQGAPTSPYISNIIARSLDRDLIDLARRHRATYTRYVDDITFSFSVRTSAAIPENICSFDSGSLTLGAELQETIRKNGFEINPEKTRMSTRHRRMEVTGLKVNRFPNVRRKFLDEIRGALNACEKHGYSNANSLWKSSFENKNGISQALNYRSLRNPNYIPELANYLRGKILFVKMVRGDEDVLYNRFADRFNAATDGITKALKAYPIVRTETELRKACFVVVWEGDYVSPSTGVVSHVGGQGTGFIYNNNRLITCDHVFYDLVEDIAIHINSSDIDKLKCFAVDHANARHDLTLLNYDQHRDLALLAFDAPPLSTRHLTAAHSQAKSGDRGLLIGYPDYSPGRSANIVPTYVNNTYPRQGLSRFEIASTIRAGYSGGPYVDESFGVVGVALRGASQDRGTDECLSVEELDKWLNEINSNP